MNGREVPKFSELIYISDVRVSCAAFADISDGSRKALTINKNRWEEKGERILTPVGGAIELTVAGLEELQGLLDINQSSFENGKDLRLIMHGKYANKLREWFLGRRNRELDPIRELREELIEETGLLSEADFSGLQFGRPGYQTELAVTDRAGQEGKLTLRLIEVYPATFNIDALSKLLEAAGKSDSMIRFVTEEEISSGFSIEKIRIGSIAKALSQPAREISRFD